MTFIYLGYIFYAYYVFIKTMASACEWQLTFFKSKYNAESQKHTAPLYYIGPESNNEMSNEDILSFAE